MVGARHLIRLRENCRQQWWVKGLLACCVGMTIAVAITVWRGLAVLNEGPEQIASPAVFHVLRSVIARGGGFRSVGIVFIVATCIAFGCYMKSTVVGEWLYRFRYLVAVALLAVLVAFGISGSSIGMWDKTLPGNEAVEGLLAGVPRGTRTDEWAMFTAMTFAQFMDPDGRLQYFSSVFRAVPTDMFILYGQPVWDIAMIFRPFQWGYLVLGLERGLSFFWCARLIVLFMATFELGMLLTRKDKGLSVGLAALVAFAPVVQWWFSINGFVEMIVFMEVIVLCMRAFFAVDRVYAKMLLCIPLIIASGGFALTLYPAWEIPMAYVTAALLIGVLVAERHHLRWTPKKDVPILGAGILLLAVGLGYVMVKSSDAISAVMNTSYPGSRISTGGGGLLLLGRSPISYITPYLAQSAATTLRAGGPDAGSMFIDLFPLGIILTAWVLFREKTRDAVLIALAVPAVLLGAYTCFGFPEWLARITVMGNSMALRCAVVLGLLNLLMLFRAVALMRRRMNWAASLAVAGVCSIAITIMCRFSEPEIMGTLKCLLVLGVIFIGMLAFLSRKSVVIATFCCFTALMAGLPVNPMQQGIAPITDNAVIRTVRQVVEEDPKARWFAAVDWQSNMMAFAGAHTIDATNTYPNPELWDVLDPDGSDRDVWNRYAHMHGSVTAGDTHYGLKQPDAIGLQMNPRDLKTLDIDYVLTNNEESKRALESSGMYRMIQNADGYCIYERN